MTDKRLVPYNLYLYAEHVDQLKKLAEKRQASELVRAAVSSMLDGSDKYSSGYNRALKDVSKLIDKCKEIEMIAFNGRYLSDILIDQVEGLKK